MIVLIMIVGNLLNKGGGGEDVLAENAGRGTVVSKVSAAGRIYPVIEVKINIERLAVREGQHVERGDILVVLDRTLYQARLEGAEASLNSQKSNAEAAMANLRQAEDLLNEQKALADQNLTSDKLLRDSQNGYDASNTTPLWPRSLPPRPPLNRRRKTFPVRPSEPRCQAP